MNQQQLYLLIKSELRVNIQLARKYRLYGERQLAVQFMKDVSELRELLNELLNGHSSNRGIISKQPFKINFCE